MTIRRLIKDLLQYPNLDAQVVDTDGSPIMYSLYHGRVNDDVRLEPKSQMDIKEELDAFGEAAVDNNMTDRDAVEELKELGYTLEDLRAYKEYVYLWALKYWD